MALAMTLLEYVTANLPSSVTVNADLVSVLTMKWQNMLYNAFGISEGNKNIDASYTDSQTIFIGDLISYDVLLNYFSQGAVSMSQSASTGSGTSSGGSSGTVSGGLKRVQTGPTEVEYFPTSQSAVDNSTTNQGNASALSSMTKPGGPIDELKGRICTQAHNLRVKIYICQDFKTTRAPQVYRP